jgi:outer membrane protein assembly factor BamA
VSALLCLVVGLLLSPVAWAAPPPEVSTSTAPVLVGSVTVNGNVDVSTHVILRTLELESGEPFDSAKTYDGQQTLYASGALELVDILISTATPHRADAVVNIKERDARYVRGGVGYGTQTKERLTLGYEHHNFLGNLRQFDIKGTYTGFITQPYKFKTRILETNLTQPYIFDTHLESHLNLAEEWDNREAYDSRATKFNASVLRRFSKSLEASLRYRLSGTELTRVSPEAETPDQTLISALGPTVTFDHTNDRFLPTLGWRVLGTWEEGLRYLGSDVGFHKLEGRTGRFDTVAGWTFFEGIQAGEMVPHTGQTADVIPIYERYFMGGANTVRGYSERGLGPKDALGQALGGEAFFATNVEVRHAIYKKIFGVLFLDGGQLYTTDPGDVWPHVKLVQLDSLAYGTGAGLRLNTPVGALRLEYGWQINPQKEDAGFWDRTALHFSIGEVF